MPRLSRLPEVVAHFDWSIDAGKRWGGIALLRNGTYEILEPHIVNYAGTLMQTLTGLAGAQGHVLVGFDFPIGVPAAYAANAGVGSFPALLPQLGNGQWNQFYDVATTAQEITLHRPFYPYAPGRKRQAHQVRALGVGAMDELLRQCEEATPERDPASPLFWTLGAKQVGKAAITGWRDVLAPALVNPALGVGLWPFAGELEQLTSKHRVVGAETYPTEAYGHLGLQHGGWSKKNQLNRQDRAHEINAWRDQRIGQLAFHANAQTSVDDGFGDENDGEDRFDAFVGLCSMLDVVLGHRTEGAPNTPQVRNIEGWILGQQP